MKRLRRSATQLMWRMMILACSMMSLLAFAVAATTEEVAPAASATVLLCSSGPATKSGWMAGAGGAGVCLFDDGTNLLLQSVNLRSSRDVSGAWPASATLGGTSGNLFTLTAWMMMGTNSALTPGLNLSGAATPLSITLVPSGGLATLRAMHGTGSSDDSLGSLPAVAPYRWVHIGASCRLHSSGTGCDWLFALNGVAYNSTSTGTRYAGPFSHTAASWGAADTGGTEKRLQGGVAEVKLWSAQSAPLTEGQLLYLARRPPSVLQGVPPVLTGLPSVMNYCQSSPLTIQVYCPFDLSVFGIASATLTITASNGVLIGGSGPVLLFNAGNAWTSSFTLATNWAWGTAFTLSFVSSEPGYMGAPPTQTIWLNSASVVRAAAAIDSRFSAATTGPTWTTPGPSGVVGSGTVVFPNAGASLTWNAANLGSGSAFPSLWSGAQGWTLALWTRFGSSNNNIHLFENYNTGNTEGVLVQLQMGPNQIRMISTVAGADSTYFFSYTLNTAVWYHMVIVGEREGTCTVYVNGVAISFVLAGVTRTSYPMQLPSLVTRLTPTTSAFKDGEFASVSFWDRALPADTVTTLTATKPEALQAFGISALTVRQYTQSFSNATEQISVVDAGLAGFSPTFQSGSGAAVYAISVPWTVFALRVTATIGSGTATLDGSCSDSVAMVTAVPSAYRWFANATTVTTMQLHVVSSIEGAYTLQITRAAPDVSAITLGAWKGSRYLGVVSSTPSFVAGSGALAFNVSLPCAATSLRVTVAFTSGNVSLVLDGVTFQSSLVSGTLSNAITVSASKMLLQVVSTLDGTRSFILHPCTANTHDVEFQFYSSGDGSSTTDFVLSPLFSGIDRSFTLTVPYRWDSFAFAAIYLSSSITYQFAGGSMLAAPASGVFVTPTLALPTAGTTYTLLVTSSVDGQFTISVTRSLQSITAIALRCNDSVSTNQLVAGPVMTPTQFSLSMDLGARWTSCAFVVTATHGHVNLTSPSVTQEPMISGVASTVHTMPSVAALVLQIDSEDDGRYALTIHCLAFSVSNVAIEAGSGVTGSTGLTAVSYSGPFVGGQLTGYAATVDFRFSGAHFAAVFATGAVSVETANPADTHALNSGAAAWGNIVLLNQGLNTIRINSTNDGVYSFAVTRSPPVFTSIVLLGFDGEGVAVAQTLWVAHNGSFVAGSYSYLYTVPHAVSQMSLRVSFGSGTVNCSFNGGVPESLSSPSSDSTRVALTEGSANAFVVDSNLDGVYQIRVIRLGPQVSAVVINAPTALALSPAFAVGSALVWHAVSVAYVCDALTVQATYGNSGILAWTLNGAAQSALSSGVSSASIPIVVGSNLIILSSSWDGEYRFNVSRRAPDMAAPSLLGVSSGSNVPSIALSPAAPTVFAFSDRQYQYALLPFVISSVVLTVSFGSPNSVTLQHLDSSLETLVTATPSQPRLLSVGVNLIMLNSSQDGSYVFNITRAGVDLSIISLQAYLDDAGSTLQSSVLASLVSQPDEAGLRSVQSLSVPFKVQSLRLTAAFGYAGSAQLGLADSAVVPLTSSAPSSALVLAVGSTSLWLNSTRDGPCVIRVTRAMPDMKGLNVTGVSLLPPVDTAVMLSPLLLPSPFVSASRVYTLSVAYWLSALTLTAEFSTAGTVTSKLGAASATTLNNRVASAVYPLSTSASNVFTVASSLDGYYQLTVTRAAPHVTGVAVRRVEIGGAVISAPVTLSPGFSSPVYLYSVQLTFLTTHVTVEATFGAGGAVTAACNSTTDAPLSLVTATPSAQFALLVGVNLITLNSTLDGIRSLFVYRAPADVTAMTFTGQTLFVPSTTPILLPTPAFVVTNHSYALTVPFVTAQIAFTLTFGTASSVSINKDGGASSNLATGVPSPLWTLGAGVESVFRITSTLDGVIVVTVRRSSADFSALSLWQQDINGFFPPTAVMLVPSFQPGVFDYTATVPYTTDRLAVQATFAVGPLSLTRVGVTSPLAAGVKTAYEPLDVLPLTNIYTIASPLDGTYTLTLSRLPFNPCASAVPLCAHNGVCVPLAHGSQPDYACNCTYGFSDYNCTTCSLGAACGTQHVGVLVPEAHLTALPQSTVGPCDLLTLDGSGSIGFSTSAPLYLWAIESVTLQDGSVFLSNLSTPLNPVSPFNETLGVTLGSFPSSGVQNSVILPAYLLIDNATYTFSLSVGVLSTYDYSPVYSSTAKVTVTKRASSVVAWMPQPLIAVPATIVRSTAAQFPVTIQQSTCAPLPADAVHSFAWVVKPAAGGSAVFTYSKIPLLIPANTLLAGTDYSVQLTLTTSSVSAGSTLGSLAAVSGSTVVTVPISVSVQPVQATILYGLRQKTVNADFTIDGSLSNDPDWAGATPPPYPITFAWTASWVPRSNPTNVAPVAVPLAPPIVTDGPSIFVPGFTFSSIVASNPRVTFRLAVASKYDSRTDSTTVDVDVMPQFPELPSVSLLAPSSRNPSQSLTIQGKVFYNSSAPTATRSDLLSFLWISVSHPYLNLQSPLLVSSDLNGPNLIVRPNILPPGYHTFRLTATDPVFVGSATPVSSYGEDTIYINSPPYAGSCSLSPSTGEALSTDFSISCSGWIDPQGYEPLQYEFSYFDLAADPSMTNVKLLKSAVSSASYSTKLPAGQLAVQVSVIDTAGATGTFLMPVNVTLPQLALTDPAAYVANMSANLATLIGQQDSASAFLFITELAGVLNTVPSTGGSTPATDQLRQDLLTSLATVAGTGTNSTMDSSTLQLVSQALGALTSDPAGLNNTQTWALAQSVLNDAISNIASSGGDVSTIVNNLATSTSNMLVNCAYLDSVSDITQTLLSAALNGQVTGSGSTLNTANLQASATRDTIARGANITLANGVTVHLTAEALAQYASLGTVSAANADTIAGQNALALDTRIVTYDPRWAVCRSGGANGIVSSALTTIDITLSNGQVVDISQLLSPVAFDIPFNLSASGLVAPRCPGDEVGNLDALARALVCSYWDPKHRNYSSAGCRNEGFNADRTAVHCSCGHLTEFAIIYRAELQALGCLGGDAAFGQPYYLAFFFLYASVGVIASLQLSRVIASSGCKHWLMAVEHALVVSVASFRGWNMINYYYLHDFIPLKWITIISGVPHLFTSWIFTFVIFAWAAIYHSSVAGRREDNPFRAYQRKFIAGNSAVSATLFTLFALMSQANINQQEVLYEAGVTIIAIVSILFALFFILYGVLLVRTLTRDFASPYARKLFTVAVAFSAAFFASSAILLTSVGASAYYNERLITFNCVYFTLDLCVLCIVMGLFKKSVADSVHANRVNKSEESTGTGTPNSSKGSSGTGRAGNGSKSEMLKKSRNTILTKGVSVHVASSRFEGNRATTPEVGTPHSDDDTDQHWTVSPMAPSGHKLSVPSSPNLSVRNRSPQGSEPGSPADDRRMRGLMVPVSGKYASKKMSLYSPNLSPSQSPHLSPQHLTPPISPPDTPLVGSCAYIPSSIPSRTRVAAVGPRRISPTSAQPSTSASGPSTPDLTMTVPTPPISPRNRLATKYTSLRTSTAQKAGAGAPGVPGAAEDFGPMTSPPVGSAWSVKLEPLSSNAADGLSATLSPAATFLHFRVASSQQHEQQLMQKRNSESFTLALLAHSYPSSPSQQPVPDTPLTSAAIAASAAMSPLPNTMPGSELPSAVASPSGTLDDFTIGPALYPSQPLQGSTSDGFSQMPAPSPCGPASGLMSPSQAGIIGGGARVFPASNPPRSRRVSIAESAAAAAVAASAASAASSSPGSPLEGFRSDSSADNTAPSTPLSPPTSRARGRSFLAVRSPPSRSRQRSPFGPHAMAPASSRTTVAVAAAVLTAERGEAEATMGDAEADAPCDIATSAVVSPEGSAETSPVVTSTAEASPASGVSAETSPVAGASVEASPGGSLPASSPAVPASSSITVDDLPSDRDRMAPLDLLESS